MTPPLPTSSRLNVAALSRLFDKTTNAYKLVFFQALLNRIAEGAVTTNNCSIHGLRELVIEMLALAWYPHRFFRLSFGLQDQIGKLLDRLEFDIEECAVTNPGTHSRLRQAIDEQYSALGSGDLLRFVPYRLLTPFFDSKLQGKPDHSKNRIITEQAVLSFKSQSPALYRFTQNRTAIELHPDWQDYLLESIAIIRGWANSHWVSYLQDKNPNTPAISKKIAPPISRSPLTRQTNFWKVVLAEHQFLCLYSNEILQPENFTLDHFLPWSFVCHDQLWNLIPVLPKANSAKGNRLPAQHYLKGFAKQQVQALAISHSQLASKAWLKSTEPYVSDLRLSHNELLDPGKLDNAYQAILPPLMSLATQIGFAPGWVYRNVEDVGVGTN